MKLKLKSNPDNPRTISKDAYQRLKKKIEKNPKGLEIHRIAHRDGIIIAGNQRWRVINDLKLELKPEWFYDLNGWSDQEVTDWLIDSNISDGEWDVDMLYNQYEPEYLLEHGIDLPYDTSSQEIEEDEAPEVDEKEPPKSKLGEVYQLGRHRVGCMDSTVKENVELLMGGVKADMVFTDPPYGVDYSGGIQFTKDGVKKNQRERLKDDQYGTDIYTEVIPIIASITDGAVYTWFAGSKGKSVYEAIESVGDIHALIIWKKNGGYSSMNANYKENKEPCLYWKPKNGKLNFIGKTTETTVWDLDKEGKNEYHPTQKPIALCAKAINNHNGELVADLFLGSGSTLIACEQTDRTCYGMELDEKYLDVIRKRYAKFISPDDWEAKWEELTPAISGEKQAV